MLPIQSGVVTGTRSDGSRATGDTCNDYTSLSGSVVLGNPLAGDSQWVGQSLTSCILTLRLYCFQTDHTAPL